MSRGHLAAGTAAARGGARAPARVGIVGVGGYTGQELWRILLHHPGVAVVCTVSDRLAGARAAEVLGGPPPVPDRPVLPREALAHLASGSLDLCLLATPAPVSAELTPRLLDLDFRVLDLSGAFRLPEAAAYPLWYGLDHPCPELLPETHRGVPELSAPPGPAVRLVANPGCYPTASALALRPFLDAGVRPAAAIVIDAKSGITGAGRKAALPLTIGEAGESISPYGYPRHRHAPEIEQLLGADAPIAFVPHLLPVRRGLLVSAHLPVADPEAPALEDPTGLLLRRYAAAPFVRVLADRFPTFRDVVGSNLAALRAVFDRRTRVLSVFCAIDNLLKGAAGQAVQHMNRLLDLDEQAGLDALSRAAG